MEQAQSAIRAALGPATADTALPGSRALAVLRTLGPARLLALGATGIGLLAFFAFLVLRLAEPEYTLLYGSLEFEDSAEITRRLEGLGVPFRLLDDGSAILVPTDRALRLRMTLAEEGLPRGGTVGNEIFDQVSALGTTNFLANVNLRRALEGELARTIASLADVGAARVHLVLPRRELFRRDQVEPSASITLRMLGSRRLDRRQVQAVQHLTAAAVPGLSPERITLVDDQGTLLARGGEADSDGVVPSQMEEFREAYEARLEHSIEQLLAHSLGAGRVDAEVSAELDFDRVTLTEETYDPDGQVVRSTQTVEEETEAAERDDDDAVTVGNNLPNLGADAAAAARTSSESTVRTEETVNYEISRTLRNHVQMGGRVRRLSVAVLVDGRRVPGEGGELTSQPLDDEELAEIASLVRSAIGFDQERGDSVEVRSMAFTSPPPEAFDEAGPWLDLTKHDLMRLVEILVLGAIGLLLILLVVRPAMRRLLPPSSVPALSGDRPPALPAGAPNPALAAPASQPENAEEPGPDAPRVDIAQVEGRVRADLIKNVRDAIDQSPDDAVTIVRGWLQEG
jgi:flagellar M-ring protein FliF